MFEIIEKSGEYTLADQRKEPAHTREDYERELNTLVEKWNQGDTPYLSLLMDVSYADKLTGLGFKTVSTIVEHSRQLQSLSTTYNQTWVTLAESAYSDEEFAAFYDACRSGSANQNNLFTMDQIMESLELEIGSSWREQTMLFKKDEEVIGIAIPHIEAGTESEGRLFYFGMIPKWRGKGYATGCHYASLLFLQTLGATHYVGSTDTANHGMIQVMVKNGALERDKKGIYRLDRVY